jgi:hypothetical protein
MTKPRFISDALDLIRLHGLTSPGVVDIIASAAASMPPSVQLIVGAALEELQEACADARAKLAKESS